MVLDRPLEEPIRRWPKLLAFAVGLAAALGAYLLVRPRLATWQSWVLIRLTSPAAFPNAVSNSAVKTGGPVGTVAEGRGVVEMSSVGLARTVRPALAPDMPGEVDTKSLLGAGNPEDEASANRPASEAHKATRSMRRHRPRRRPKPTP